MVPSVFYLIPASLLIEGKRSTRTWVNLTCFQHYYWLYSHNLAKSLGTSPAFRYKQWILTETLIRISIMLGFFIWSFSSHSRIFSLIWRLNRSIADEGLYIFTYARHVWPLSSEGSLGHASRLTLQSDDLCDLGYSDGSFKLACHTYCNTGHPFINNGHLRGPVTLTPNAKRLTVELSLPALTTYVWRAGIRTTNLPLAGPF